MLRRHALPLAGVVAALALVAPVAGAATAIKPLPGGFGAHCGTGAEKKSCQDILDNSAAAKPQLFFQPNKTYCSVSQLNKGMRGVGVDFYPQVKRTKGGFTAKFTYRDDQREGNPGSIDITFTITGRYTAPNRLRVVIKGKVIGTVPSAADCAKVKFTEVHILKHL